MATSRSSPRLLLVATAIVGIVGGCFLALNPKSADGALHEKKVALAGHPVFQSDSSSAPSTVLIATVDSDPLKRKFAWPQKALPAGELPPEKSLRFTFFDSPRSSSWPLELLRIEGDSGPLYDASVCLVHREAMHRTLVRLLQPSDLISPSPAIEEMLFPHCGVLLAGPGSGSFEVPAWVCDSCHRERDRWLDKARRTASASN
jgi:hypothetical protein